MSTSPNYNHRHRPTSDPSSVQDSPSSSSINMARSSSSDHGKMSKRKGTRSVSTLTPAQLARKRANDREAQRAIRARTKEHIERLEAELDELRNQDRDSAFQQLLRKNKALQEELDRLRDMLGVSTSSYPKSVYDDSLSTGSGGISSTRTSPFPAGAEYTASGGQLGPDYGNGSAQAPYVAFPPTSDAWASSIPASVPSNVSTISSPSPVSSVHDDFNTGYLPTSAPNPMMPSPGMGGSMRGEDIKMEYEDGNDHGYRLARPTANSRGGSAASTPPLPTMAPQVYMQQHYVPQQSQHPHQSSPWGMCAPMYYSHVPSPTVH